MTIRLQLTTFALFAVFLTSSGSPLDQSPSSSNGLSTPSSRFYIPEKDHLFFAGDNFVTVYVNGIQVAKTTDWNNIGYVPLSVRKGDVISLRAKDVGVWFGVVAQLSINGQKIVTGRDDWRARKAFPSPGNAWMKPSYSACRWRRPRIISQDLNYIPGKSRYFPRPSAARYVWAYGAGVNDEVFLRYKVGGESCSFPSTVTFAGDNKVTMYVNGVFKAVTTDWGVTKKVNLNLNKGDVVAFKVEDFGVWWGLIAAIKTGGWYSTGSEEWRAEKAFNIAGDSNAWMMPWYNACGWNKPQVLPNAGKIFPGKSANFPYAQTGAKYVWARGAGENSVIYVRTVIGVQC